MSVLSDGSIVQRSSLITPFNPRNVGSASVDLTLSDIFVMVDGNKTGGIIRMDSPITYATTRNHRFILPPGRFVLASTTERIKLPSEICAEISGRSSIGRMGLFVENAGWFDPGFEGNATLELYNANDYPIELVAGRRICQIIFHWLDDPSVNPYSGKYRGQHATGTVGSRIYEDNDQ